MARAKRATDAAVAEPPEAPQTPRVIREIHEFIASSKDPETGRELPERLEKHTEWTEALEHLAGSKGKVLLNCLEWVINPETGERNLTHCVQIPTQDARRWFDLGIQVYDTSGIEEVMLAGKKDKERSDAILQSLIEQQQNTQELIKVIADALTKQKEGD